MKKSVSPKESRSLLLIDCNPFVSENRILYLLLSQTDFLGLLLYVLTVQIRVHQQGLFVKREELNTIIAYVTLVKLYFSCSSELRLVSPQLKLLYISYINTRSEVFVT